MAIGFARQSEARFLSTIFYPNQAENGILDSRKTFLTPFIADFLNAPAKMRSQGFLFLCFGFGAKKSAVKPAIIGAKNKLFKTFKTCVQRLATKGLFFVGLNRFRQAQYRASQNQKLFLFRYLFSGFLETSSGL